jgi:site-specific recombinase XerD
MKAIAAGTFTVLFHLRDRKENTTQLPIYARITINRKRMEISTKQSCEKKLWNAGRGMAKATSEEARKLNNYLEQLRSTYSACYREMTLKKIDINIETFKNNYYGLDKKKEYTLNELIHYHNVDMKDSLRWGTMKNYSTTQKYLEGFLNEKKHFKDILLNSINYQFVIDFEYYLKTYVPLEHKKRLGNNGIMKHMERFRKLFNLALRNEWVERDPFKGYKLRFNKFERGYLTEEELRIIENKNFKIERLNVVRDLFVFSCYTGMAYIDAVSLKKTDIVKGLDGQDWIVIQRIKSGSTAKLPLLPKALEIIEKYATHIRCLAENTLLPKMSNQRLNGYLKEIADTCGIEKNITFHLARHTFATTITLSNGVPIESVSKMLGHSKISTTQVYAKVVEKKLSDDMEMLKKKLAEKSSVIA